MSMLEIMEAVLKVCQWLTSGHLSMQGYAYVPPSDDEALMEAVYSRGTIAISLDASQPSFRFYASGACWLHPYVVQLTLICGCPRRSLEGFEGAAVHQQMQNGLTLARASLARPLWAL